MIIASIPRETYILLYVDDILLIDNPEAIDETLELFWKNGLVLKVDDRLQNYLSCEISFTKSKKKTWLWQPYLIECLENKFGKQVMVVWSNETPCTLIFSITRPISDIEKFCWRPKIVSCQNWDDDISHQVLKIRYCKCNLGIVQSDG